MSDLQRVVQLAELLLKLRENVERLETQLEDAKKDMRRVEQEDLPDLMQELGLKPEVDCGISEERRARAHDWLTVNGFGGLIKTEVVAKFGRDEREEAVRAASLINGEMVERVHPSTLKSFIKEQMAAGNPVPFDLFGVHPYNKVKITAPKK
jgi:predicted nuclease with TOPRIM domain